jgi:hypothetical protein
MSRRGVKVRVFAPRIDLGSMLDTSNSVIRRRWIHGEEIVDDPVLL